MKNLQCKKGCDFPVPRQDVPNQTLGITKLFLARESLFSDILDRDGKIVKFFTVYVMSCGKDLVWKIEGKAARFLTMTFFLTVLLVIYFMSSPRHQ
jgi:hypothetical protein